MILKVIKNLVPRFVYVRRQENNKENLIPRLLNKNDDTLDKTMEWWEKDLFTKIKRYYHFRWFGITWFKIPTYESLNQTYFKDVSHILDVFKKLENEKIIPKLTKTSKILEPGCSVGQNLWYLKKKYDCNIYGIDISKSAITKAKENFKNLDNIFFETCNVLKTNYFDNLSDNFFDVIIVRNHLLNIPFSSNKIDYVEILKQKSKCLIIMEQFKENYFQTNVFHEGKYVLSWEDWSKEYNLKEFYVEDLKRYRANAPNEKVYYFLKNT